jgi:NAD(P)-dependent dehydrogenase (short-subunit alcohol dehydrogenase family)
MESKKVFITGASSGIGLATAQALVKAGHEVWGTSRSAERLPKMERFHPLEMDLNGAESIREAFERMLEQAGRVDVLINNAGSGVFGAIEECTEASLRDQFQTLVFGPVQLLQLALPVMRHQDGGLVINVSSLAAQFPIPFLGVYSSAKAAMASLTQTLRLELENKNVRIVDLQPGDINTPFHDSMKRAVLSANSPYSEVEKKVYECVDKSMRSAQSPEVVANSILRIVQSINPPPVVRVGDFFQAKLAPLARRLMSTRLMECALRWYYGLK